MSAVPVSRLSSLAINARAGAATALVAIILGAAPGQSARADAVVAVVNGTPVHEGELQVADEMVGRNLVVQDPVERREIILKMVVDTILLSQLANERKIGNEADLQRRITFARNQGLMNQVLADVGQKAVTEETMRKTYEEVVKRAETEEAERHLRHLYFRVIDSKDEAAMKVAEDKARSALDRINKGEDFVAVLTDVTEDPVAKANGGDYGWRLPGEMGREFSEASAKLKKGEVALFKTGVGWHIIRLEDTRPRKQPDYERVRDRLAAMVSSKAQIELVHKLRAEAKVERKDEPKTVGSKGEAQGK